MIFENTYRSLPEKFYSDSLAPHFPAPSLIKFNNALATELNLNVEDYSNSDLANIFSAQKILPTSKPISMAYAAHQFGHFVPQLGDGRAMLLGEVVNQKGERYDIHLKGSGDTAYSRNGDGRSALGPVIREYIVSEAMHRLGIPSTRALAAVSTGESVFRETKTPGGVFTRVAKSHIRIGTFQYFAAREDTESLEILLDYSIKRLYPSIYDKEGSKVTDTSLAFFKDVISAQVSLVAQWMSIGFIHGVMNTDNTSISGETIDYGPCAFMDKFKHDQVYSFIDKNGRYAYNNQKSIFLWNLARLADCLIPLIHPELEKAKTILIDTLTPVAESFDKKWVSVMIQKFGLAHNPSHHEEDKQLIESWLDYLQEKELDFTLSFRNLAMLIDENTEKEQDFFNITPELKEILQPWRERIAQQSESRTEIIDRMNAINPLYIPRNHKIEEVIEACVQGNYESFEKMNKVLSNPYMYQEGMDEFMKPPQPNEEIEATFCGT